ncbi:hypothetical protein MUK42_15168 [Musa troglodytarum]|uniref:Uncharacterized protein n=1 Tax=Musa troglodytarum TaxID=320322 RepID=A0A9E7HZH5_9LILI|nr:hypothetical protein MUK42_15168 [Musa troglodytarum]
MTRLTLSKLGDGNQRPPPSAATSSDAVRPGGRRVRRRSLRALRLLPPGAALALRQAPTRRSLAGDASSSTPPHPSLTWNSTPPAISCGGRPPSGVFFGDEDRDEGRSFHRWPSSASVPF